MESFKCLKEISDYKTNPYVSMVKGWLYFQNILMGTSKDSKLDMKLARDIAEASKKSLSNGMPYILAGWLDLLSKDFVNTEKNARKALEVDPFNSKIIPVAGSLLRRLGQYNDALPVFTKTLELSSNPAHWVWVEYAITLTALKQYERANEIIEKALKTKEAGTQNTILILNLSLGKKFLRETLNMFMSTLKKKISFIFLVMKCPQSSDRRKKLDSMWFINLKKDFQ